MLSIISRSRWVPTSRTSWPLSASGKLSAVAIMPDPSRLTVVIVFPPKSQNKVRTKYRADQTSKSHANPPHYTSFYTSSVDFSLESVLRSTHKWGNPVWGTGIRGRSFPAGGAGVLSGIGFLEAGSRGKAPGGVSGGPCLG